MLKSIRLPQPRLAGTGDRRGFLRAFGWLAFTLCVPGLFAADPAAATGEPLRVGVSPVFPPMVFKQGKELVGVEVDMARHLAIYLGRPSVFVEVPWKEQIAALNDRRTDIIMSSMSITDSTLIWYLAGMHAADGLTVAPMALSEEQLAWAVRKPDDALLTSVNTFIAQARQNGTFLKLFQRWTSVGN